jgi:hypothetical protein
MNRNIFTCQKTGTNQIILSADCADLAHSYYTANSWADGEHLVLSRMENRKHSMACRLFLVDITTGEERFLTEKAFWSKSVVQDSFVYHLTEHEILRTGLADGKTELLWSGDFRYRLDGPPSLTADGHYLSLYWELADKSTSINRFDIQTGRMEEVYHTCFHYPFEIANHCMLNPQNPNLMFFSHEGNCNYITNRLWLADCEKHTAYNLFKQRLNQEGGNGEPSGHEMWAPDGKGVYFIKYITTTIPPKGVMYFDLAKNEAKSIASKYEYWHAAAAPDSVRVCADTQINGDTSEVVYIDPQNGVEKIVALAKTDWAHPCHPHPQFSPDGRYICYTALGENEKTVVGIVEAK